MASETPPAALAAPALPPSVAEAREAVLSSLRAGVRAEWGQRGYHPATDRRIDRDDASNVEDVDALIAAVRAETVAEAVRVVEELPDHLTAADDPRETFLWRADVLAALRALEVQP